MSSRVLVVDASVVVELLRGTSLGDRAADSVRGAAVAAPAHLDAEVLSALGRLARAGTVTDEAVARAVTALERLPLTRRRLAPLLRRAWALRENIALRDGLYVACAEATDATLVTIDSRLARSAPVTVTHVG